MKLPLRSSVQCTGRPQRLRRMQDRDVLGIHRRLHPERPADMPGQDPHPLRRHSQHPGDAVAHPPNALGCPNAASTARSPCHIPPSPPAAPSRTPQSGCCAAPAGTHALPRPAPPPPPRRPHSGSRAPCCPECRRAPAAHPAPAPPHRPSPPTANPNRPSPPRPRPARPWPSRQSPPQSARPHTAPASPPAADGSGNGSSTRPGSSAPYCPGNPYTPPASFAVITACTPGIASASAVSTPRITACA